MELTKKVSNAWREFFSSAEAQEGMQWILSQRPPLDSDSWQKAAGFEEFKKRIDMILENERARRDRDEQEDSLKS